MKTFRQKLKEVRASQNKTQKARRALTDQELGLTDRWEERMQAKESLLSCVRTLMEDVTKEIPGSSMQCGFYEGKDSLALIHREWALSVRGPRTKNYSRVQFLVGVRPNSTELEVSCKITIFQRDLKTEHCSADYTTAQGMKELKSFAEAQMLRFARSYFVNRRESVKPSGTRVPRRTRKARTEKHRLAS